jgi:hypothetical protein
MLEINVVLQDSYDETTETFVKTKTVKVTLEHSLFTVSKWESVWEEPFLSNKDKTQKQTLSYIEMMIVDEELPPGVFQKLVSDHLEEVMAYVQAPMTAKVIAKDPRATPSREIVTSELIYYWMISMNIPVQFEHWHLNRLMNLIQVFNLKNSPKRKMTAKERQDLNRQRLKQHNTRG